MDFEPAEMKSPQGPGVPFVVKGNWRDPDFFIGRPLSDAPRRDPFGLDAVIYGGKYRDYIFPFKGPCIDSFGKSDSAQRELQRLIEAHVAKCAADPVNGHIYPIITGGLDNAAQKGPAQSPGSSPSPRPHYAVAAALHAQAGAFVQGDRASQHGDFKENFANIAGLWNAYLLARPDASVPLGPLDVAHMMVLLKIARTQSGAHTPDDYVDQIGYATIAAGVACAAKS